MVFAICARSAVGMAQINSVVTVDTNLALVINGRTVFPIGLSPGPPNNALTPAGKDALQEFRDSGALLLRIAQSTDWSSTVISNQQAALDWAAQHGMFCWINLRELSQFSSGDTNTPAALRYIVDLFKDHPGMGLWKNLDEAWLAGVSVANLSNGFYVIKQEDANHPVVQTHAPRGTVSDLQPYNVAADILALDIYPVAIPPPSNPPITNTGVSQLGDWTQVLSQVANGQKEFWMIEQIAFSGTTPLGKTLTFPTYTQSRFMAYEAIANGARGLMFFGGNVAATLTNATDAALGWNWSFWNSTLNLVVEQLGDHSLLAKALVAPASSLPITLSGTSFPDIEFCVREVPPCLYIIATKREGATTNVTFSGLPSWAANGEVLYESRTITAAGGQFTDSFAPLDVHVYRFAESNFAPSILFPPQNQTNNVTSTATFSVTADGAGPLLYQWRKNGLNLADSGNVSGATTPRLTLSNVSPSDAASYDVVVNGFGSVTSSPPATLTIISNQAPVIISQPRSQTNTVGASASFTVAAVGPSPLSYQWRKNGSPLSDGGSISGATSPNLMLSNLQFSDAGGYDVVITMFGSVTSAPIAALNIVASSLLLYEPFNYDNIGTPVSFNNPANWTFNGSGANDLNVAPGSLTFAGLPTSIGNSVTNGGNGLGTRRLVGTGVNSGTIYFSALFRVNNIGYGVWSGSSSQVGALTASDNTSFRLQVMAKATSSAGYTIGVQKGGTGVSATFDNTLHTTDETILLVGKYDFNTSPNSVYLWINPDVSTFGAGSPPANFISANTGIDGSFLIDRFNMRQNTASTVPAAMQWDELRIGTSWAAVTPPGSIPAPNITSFVQLPDLTFRLTYTNYTSNTFTLYASTNLSASWSAIGAATQISPGVYQFTDTTATNSSSRFYQLRSP